MTGERLVNGFTIAATGIALGAVCQWLGDRYILHVVALIAAYWILIAGLNLVVGYVGQLSIGHIGLLALGAYAFAILAGRFGWPPELAMLVAGAVGAAAGFALGLPSLRLPSFYFAMATLAFATVVTELTVARADLTAGGAGLSVPGFSGPFATPAGRYWLAIAIAIAATVLTWNVARFMYGSALVAIRESDVAASSVGVPIYRSKLTVFTFSGFTAGISGALFASLQTYITPETFHFDLGMLFFICIIVGGQTSIIGPFIGTVFLMSLPEIVAPLAAYGGIIYGVVLLLAVLLIPGGFGDLVWRLLNPRTPRRPDHEITPDPERLRRVLAAGFHP